MDLLQTVRKEGSRGGRADFKWDDVKNDHHRENYLGHSLMAPVGRWQKGKDLNWYANADGDQEGKSEAELRKEEMRRVKEAEEEAMAKALGYEVPPKKAENPNQVALGERKSVQETVKESLGDVDRIEGYGQDDKSEAQREGHREHKKRHRRSRSRDGKDREKDIGIAVADTGQDPLHARVRGQGIDSGTTSVWMETTDVKSIVGMTGNLVGIVTQTARAQNEGEIVKETTIGSGIDENTRVEEGGHRSIMMTSTIEDANGARIEAEADHHKAHQWQAWR
ncbi:MAG: hypothetical protein M1831_002005 [Alyxoria varia]|nr:MAG: hypothetical protein M1831_002005 [Alyxoria varia]